MNLCAFVSDTAHVKCFGPEWAKKLQLHASNMTYASFAGCMDVVNFLLLLCSCTNVGPEVRDEDLSIHGEPPPYLGRVHIVCSSVWGPS